jgi:hypothetical protein
VKGNVEKGVIEKQFDPTWQCIHQNTTVKGGKDAENGKTKN